MALSLYFSLISGSCSLALEDVGIYTKPRFVCSLSFLPLVILLVTLFGCI